MKYKVGDKVRVRRDLETTVMYGVLCAIDEMLKEKIVTIKSVHDGYYKVAEDGYRWTDEMLEGLAEDELTAEEAIRFKCEMCESISCSECKFSRANNGEDIYCNKFLEKYPEQVVEILKQWKKVHEEEIGNSDSCMDVLKNYCENHDGKFFSIMEFRYEVKQ